LLTLLGFLGLFITGHYIGALIVYLNHRFVFHGRLRRWPLLKGLARLHGLHHAHHSDDFDRYIFVPMWGKLLLALSLFLVSLISLPLACGIGSFSLLYMHRHWAIHNGDNTSKFHKHHNMHHTTEPNKNYSGMYPFIDKIFGTYVES